MTHLWLTFEDAQVLFIFILYFGKANQYGSKQDSKSEVIAKYLRVHLWLKTGPNSRNACLHIPSQIWNQGLKKKKQKKPIAWPTQPSQKTSWVKVQQVFHPVENMGKISAEANTVAPELVKSKVCPAARELHILGHRTTRESLI